MTEITMAAQKLSTQFEFGSRTFWALLPLFLLILAIVGYALLDLLRAEHARYLPKPVWALLIVLGSAPLGALAYLVVGRTRHEADRGDQCDAAGHRLGRYEPGVRL